MESWREELYNSGYLMHHGIKGQRWGVRRFQNEDGTLTNAGKARYADNYSDSQRTRDEKIYGKKAMKRINERMLNGESIQSARHDEVVRKERKDKTKATLRRIAKPARDVAIGVAGAAVLALGVTAVKKMVNGEKIVLKDLPRDTINMGKDIVNGLFGGRSAPKPGVQYGSIVTNGVRMSWEGSLGDVALATLRQQLGG